MILTGKKLTVPLLLLVATVIGCDVISDSGSDQNRKRVDHIPFEGNSDGTENPEINGDQWITAYLASWKHAIPSEDDGNLPTDQIDWSAFTHMNYFAFTIEADGSLESVDEAANLSSERLQAIVSAAHDHNTPILFTVGEWGESNDMSEAIAPETRSKLVNTLVPVMNEWGFDGIDLNPETLEGTDDENFKSFVNELHREERFPRSRM